MGNAKNTAGTIAMMNNAKRSTIMVNANPASVPTKVNFTDEYKNLSAKLIPNTAPSGIVIKVEYANFFTRHKLPESPIIKTQHINKMHAAAAPAIISINTFFIQTISGTAGLLGFLVLIFCLTALATTLSDKRHSKNLPIAAGSYFFPLFIRSENCLE